MTAYEPLRTVRKMTGRFALIPSHVTCELNSHESHGAAKGSVIGMDINGRLGKIY